MRVCRGGSMAEKKSTMYDLEAEKIREKIIIFAVDAGGILRRRYPLRFRLRWMSLQNS